MAPQLVVVAVAVIMLLQLLFFAKNSGTKTIIKPSYTPPPPISHEEIVPFLTSSEPFPRKIWQTSKNGPAGMEDGDKENVLTWTKLNQKWRYEAITQYSAESYVRESFEDRPEIVEIFTDLQDPILRADFVRYLVLLKDGGLYSDLDTKSLKPIEDWIPVQYLAETDVVVGVEYDKLDGDRWSDWTLDLQLTSWAILAKPAHPVMELTVQKVLRGLKDLALEQGTTVAKVRPSYNQVLDVTGPAAFTRAVFEYIAYELGEKYTWKNVTNLQSPLLIKGILILPITAFGCGQQHSNSQGPDHPTALVHHLFKGSWKNDHDSHGGGNQIEEDLKKELEKLQKEKEDKERVEEEERKKQDEDDKSRREKEEKDIQQKVEEEENDKRLKQEAEKKKQDDKEEIESLYRDVAALNTDKMPVEDVYGSPIKDKTKGKVKKPIKPAKESSSRIKAGYSRPVSWGKTFQGAKDWLTGNKD